MRLSPYWKVMLALAVVALCSGAIGAAVALRIQNQRQAQQSANGPLPEASAERMATLLQLTPTQREQLRPMFERSQGEIRALASNTIAQAVQARKRLEAEARPLLTPEQRRRLDELIERREGVWGRLQRGDYPFTPSPEQRERFGQRMQQRYNARTNQSPAAAPAP
jgi:Spy/CpxP family protein refolding chaperone